MYVCIVIELYCIYRFQNALSLDTELFVYFIDLAKEFIYWLPTVVQLLFVACPCIIMCVHTCSVCVCVCACSVFVCLFVYVCVCVCTCVMCVCGHVFSVCVRVLTCAVSISSAGLQLCV